MKHRILLIITLLVIAGLTYLSKPDRGGIDRCQRIFGFDSLSQRGLEKLSLSSWSPFENAKFRLRIKNNQFEALKLYLYNHGYEKWEEGGLEYGSLIIGCEGSAPLQYSFKHFHGHEHIIAYNRTDNLIYAIVSQ